jgi:hypothetical protein
VAWRHPQSRSPKSWRSVTGFVAFQIYAVLALASPIIAARALLKRDFEAPGVSMIVFLLSLIGLSCNWREFIRVFSAIYGMEWWG